MLTTSTPAKYLSARTNDSGEALRIVTVSRAYIGHPVTLRRFERLQEVVRPLVSLPVFIQRVKGIRRGWLLPRVGGTGGQRHHCE